MISVIIPALNEVRRIGGVVSFARRAPGVREVLVIDDGSIDGTPEAARAAGARVLTSSMLGKGASMADGIAAARSSLLVFLDGDLSDLDDNLIPRLVAPLQRGTADFVKASFSRSAGRVTLLSARPLLVTFFPELSHITQPLGGIIAIRRRVARRLSLESDYGVDVGLLIDAHAAGAILAQVDVGHIEHESQSLEALGAMAVDVTRTILARAARHGRLGVSQIQAVDEVERHQSADLPRILGRLGRPDRLAIFDMDGTLLKGRFVVSLARAAGRWADVRPLLDNPRFTPDERTRAIGRTLIGVPRHVFEQVARSVPLMPGAAEIVVALRRVGFRVGVVTDSFFVAAEVVRRRVFADFSVAHRLTFAGHHCSGEVTLAPSMRHDTGCEDHPTCKSNVLRHILEATQLAPERVLAVGDGENDICLLRAAGHSVAFRPRNGRVADAAQHVVRGSIQEILQRLAPELLIPAAAPSAT